MNYERGTSVKIRKTDFNFCLNGTTGTSSPTVFEPPRLQCRAEACLCRELFAQSIVYRTQSLLEARRPDKQIQNEFSGAWCCTSVLPTA